MFVDWKPKDDGLEGSWIWGVDVDPDVLAQSMLGLQTRINLAMADWT